MVEAGFFMGKAEKEARENREDRSLGNFNLTGSNKALLIEVAIQVNDPYSG